jgi:heat shock protein HslJ/uncharacterized lipoprotein NlpE involved in copper resistance
MVKRVTTMIAILLFTACGFLLHAGPSQGVTGTGSTVIKPPITYSGILPCVACAGRNFTLSLRPDGLFLLRQVYLSNEKGKENKTLIEQGSWSASADGSRISLWGGIEMQRQLAIRNADTLRLLDERGREIQSALNYDLARSSTFDPIAEPFRKRWMYVRGDGNGFAIDCIKGLRFPVAAERDNAALDAAYGKAHPAENAPLVVEFEGHFARRPKSQGSGDEDAVVVDKFLLVGSGEGCSGSLPVGGMEDSYWKLVDLNGGAVLAAQQEPHLRLESVLRKVTVAGGCNNFQGTYKVNQGNLQFAQIAGTRKACPQPIMDQENALLKAIEATTTFRLFNEALELYGQGKRLARLERRQEKK